MRPGDSVKLDDVPGILLSVSTVESKVILWVLTIEGITPCKRGDIEYAG